LVVGWLANISLFRTQQGSFKLRQFFHGAFSGGGAVVIAMIVLAAIEWMGSNSLGLTTFGLLRTSFLSIPVVLISGLYSAFATNVDVATGQGITWLAYQILFYFLYLLLVSLTRATYQVAFTTSLNPADAAR
jgi:hypothetical protein